MAPIEQRLKSIPFFMNEPGRKLFAYDRMCRDPVDWGVIRRYQRSHFAGSPVTMILSLASYETGETLAVLQNIALGIPH